MSENSIKLKNEVKQKNSRKFSGVLRSLAQSKNLISNKIEILIFEDEIIEEKDKIYIIPSKFKNYSENSID